MRQTIYLLLLSCWLPTAAHSREQPWPAGWLDRGLTLQAAGVYSSNRPQNSAKFVTWEAAEPEGIVKTDFDITTDPIFSPSTVDLADPPELVFRIGQDLRDLVRLPRRLDAKGWRRIGYGLLAVGAVRLADDELRDWASDGSSGSFELADAVRPLGGQEALGLLAATWLGSRAFGNERLQAVSEDALEATILSAALIAAPLKILTGRRRPGGGDRRSFPSGDTTQIFAMATAIAAHSEHAWVDGLAYGIAGLVAWERVRLDQHWPSDVVAGALLGWSVSRWVVRRNRSLWADSEPRLRWSPLVADGTYGVGLSWKF